MEYLVVAGSFLWVALILVPWRPWSTRERLEPGDDGVEADLSDVTVLIPARNEAAVIERTLLMTWSSALRYWRGKRSEWKGRVYAREERKS